MHQIIKEGSGPHLTTICLIRHGQTTWNKEGRFQGQADIPLDDTGMIQAREVAQRLIGKDLSAIYSSDLIRARQTAEQLSSVYKLPVHIDHRLREINQGQWEGQLFDEIQLQNPDFFQRRLIEPLTMRPPGGETILEVRDRLLPAIDEISKAHLNEKIAIVSHGLAIAVIYSVAMGLPLEKAFSMIPPNAEPLWIEWEPA